MEFRHFLKTLQDEGGLKAASDVTGCGGIPARVAAEEAGDNRPLLFDRLADFGGPVVTNLFGSEERICRSIGAPDITAYFNRVEQALATPAPLNITDGQQDDYTIIKDPQLMAYLPPLLSSKHDSTPFITSGVVLARDPDTGRHHLCFIRLSVQDGNKVLFNPRTPRIKEIVGKTLGRGTHLDIAVLIGAPTEVLLLGALRLLGDADELGIAQALGGSSLAFFEHGLPIPVSTEMVLFGRVSGDMAPEGPFGDFTGMYSTHENPVCVISELWQRPGAAFHTILGATSREHVELLVLKAKFELERLKATHPGLLEYRLPRYGAGQTCLITVAADAVMDDLISDLSEIPLVKLFVFLSDDTSSMDPSDVMWALTQRAREPDAYRFNKAVPEKGFPERAFIDATARSPSDWDNIRVDVFE